MCSGKFSVNDFPPLQNDLILRAARGEQTERVPVWLMRQAGRYLPEYGQAKGARGFFETCRNPQLVCELTIQPIKRFALDAAIIFSDILVIPIALGLKTANDPGTGPVFEKPIQTPDDLARLNPDFDIQQTLGYVYKAITLTRKTLEGQVPLFGFSGAPWTLMKYMIENLGAGPNPNKTRRFLVEFPEAGEKLLKIITDAVIRHLVEQIKAGAQIVQVFDSLAGEMGPTLFTKYELPCLREIAYRVKDKLTTLGITPVPMVVFAKDAHFAIEQLSSIGFDVVSLDWTMQPTHCRRLAGSSVTLQGNLDPVILFTKEDEIRKEVKEMLQKFGTQRYIANLGHGVMKETNPDTVGIFVDAVHSLSEEINKQS
ncbi:uroporphyrinogen decarboxylase-like isoform X2 [Gigantopelta aegis]|uniref:uroporphyrinogen decarboxylase-like isoform X2 n=1 Tax=Gigantopelta aegis TaxID=1735272 RepID=UPI001B88BD4F|nr:uroporphyrinogen decarboxylase-like isoform X2 [Gigantopelta aegis]